MPDQDATASAASEPASEVRVPTGLPKIYADTVVNVVYGTATSKIILGDETGGDERRPTAVVVLPTTSLVLAALMILRDTKQDAFIAETHRRFDAMLNLYRNGIPDVPDDPKH